MKEHFKSIKDPRQTGKVRHKLLDIIVMTSCAVIAGCDVWEDIADYCRVKEEWFREALGMELAEGIPSHDTFSRVFSLIDPEEMHQCFQRWVEDTCKHVDREIISVDGKTARGSKSKDRNALHVVSAWAHDAGISLGQIATEEKSNEITAVPALLETLDIKGTIVTADAMSCQKEITSVIALKGGDYVIGLKRNQPSAFQEAVDYYEAALSQPQFYSEIAVSKTEEKGHGRIERRVYYLSTAPELMRLYADWKGIRSIGMMRSHVLSGETVTEETHYYITSLTDVQEFSRAARGHWGVESSLHWCLDVTFREDHSRIRKDHSAENFSVIRQIALNVLKHMPDRMSVARRRRHCSYDDAYLQKVMLSFHA